MLTNTQYLTRHMSSLVLGVTSWAIGSNILGSFISNGFNILISFILFPVTYSLVNKGLLMFQQSKRSKQLGITRQQFLHIEDQLSIATKQSSALTQSYVQVRSVKSFKTIYEMGKITKRIISLVRKDPTKFFMIEEFFYGHLPSAVELSNKYALLTKEQVGGTDIHLALNDARKMIKSLYETMESDLKIALTSDIESLKLELDYAKLASEERQSQLKVGGDN